MVAALSPMGAQYIGSRTHARKAAAMRRGGWRTGDFQARSDSAATGARRGMEEMGLEGEGSWDAGTGGGAGARGLSMALSQQESVQCRV